MSNFIRNGVNSVTGADSSIAVSPTTGSVQVSIDTANNNDWTGEQKFYRTRYENTYFLTDENSNLYYSNGAVLANSFGDLYGSDGVIRFAGNGDLKFALFAGNGTFVDLLGNGYFANGNPFFDAAGVIYGDGSGIYNASHSTLNNLSADDHPFYTYYPGRVGGQTIYGGNQANEDLYLEPTAHGTKTTARLALASLGGEVQIGAASGKVGLYAVTPIVQPTTAIAASTFTANTSGIANDTATFDGYTIGQVVKALRNMGILA